MKTMHAAMTVALLALGTTRAAEDDKAGRPWQLELGVGASYEPNYSSADASSPRLLLWASGEYRTERWGTFALDSGLLTLDPQLRWTFGDDKNYGIGPLLGYRTGRNDSDPGWFADSGNDRLEGNGQRERHGRRWCARLGRGVRRAGVRAIARRPERRSGHDRRARRLPAA